MWPCSRRPEASRRWSLDQHPECLHRSAAELTPEAVAAIAEQVRVRVLRWFARSGLIEADDVREMLAWNDAPEPMPDWDVFGQRERDVEFDRRIAW